MSALASLDAVFAALADPTRRAIIERLSEGVCSVIELGAPFEMSAPAISKHLRVLESAGLIRRAKQGLIAYCQLTTAPLESARQWWEEYRQFWDQQLDSLEQFLEEEEPKWPSQPRRKVASSSGSSGGSPHRASGSSKRGRTRRH